MTQSTASTTRHARSWSPLGFLPLDERELAEHTALSLADAARGPVETFGSPDDTMIWVRRLKWDSDHFGAAMYRIEFVESGPEPSGDALRRGLADLTAQLARNELMYHVTAEIPADRPPMSQAFSTAGFRLIETRLTYFMPDVSSYSPGARSPVRLASVVDIPNLRKVAATARNPWDRYHADPFFGEEVADSYLATYAEECVRGFADLVLIPDDSSGALPGAFFGVTLDSRAGCSLGVRLEHECRLGLSIGRIPLAAVGQDRRGWHIRLLSEATILLAERGADVVIMTTQLANRAVIRNCEKLGYRLGRATHVFSSWRR